LKGTVLRVTPGSPVRVLVDVGFPLVAAVTPRSAQELGLTAGTSVTAIFKASAVHVIDQAVLDTPSRPGLYVSHPQPEVSDGGRD
jgi:tungstate transport system ATP-binding protein